MPKSSYLRDNVLNHMIRNQAFTPPATVYLSMHTADPGITGASEVVGGGYARQPVTFGAASGGVIASNADVNFANMPAVAVTHGGLWTAQTGGNFLYPADVADRTLQSGDTLTVPAGQATVTES